MSVDGSGEGGGLCRTSGAVGQAHGVQVALLDDAVLFVIDRPAAGLRVGLLQPGLCAGQHFARDDRLDGVELLVVVAELWCQDDGAIRRTSGGGCCAHGQGGLADCQVQEAFFHGLLQKRKTKNETSDIHLPLWGCWLLFEYNTVYLNIKAT